MSRTARLLAAAGVYQAMRAPRPHREARPPDEAAAELRADVKADAWTPKPSTPCWAPPDTAFRDDARVRRD